MVAVRSTLGRFSCAPAEPRRLRGTGCVRGRARLPTVGQLVRALVNALDLRQVTCRCPRERRFSTRSARRYLFGEPARCACCVLSATVHAFLALAGPIVRFVVPEEFLPVMGPIALAHVRAWDAHVRERLSADDLVATLRFFATDLAVRFSLVLNSLNLPDFPTEQPLWLASSGSKRFLQSLLDRCESRTTRAELIAAIKVHRNAFPRWFAGKATPSRENREDLANALAARIPGTSARSLELSLRMHFGMRTLSRDLAECVGQDVVEELVAAVVRMANHRAKALRRELSPETPLRGARLLLVLHAPWLIHMREALEGCCLRDELDPEWLADIDRVQRAWLPAPDLQPSIDALRAALLETQAHAPRHRDSGA